MSGSLICNIVTQTFLNHSSVCECVSFKEKKTCGETGGKSEGSLDSERQKTGVQTERDKALC